MAVMLALNSPLFIISNVSDLNERSVKTKRQCCTFEDGLKWRIQGQHDILKRVIQTYEVLKEYNWNFL